MHLFGRRGWTRFLPFLGMLPALALYGLFSLGPSLATVFLSLTDISGVPDDPWHFIGLANYHEFFFLTNARDNLIALGHTLLFSCVVTLLQNVLGLLLAIVLQQKIRGRTFYRAVIFLPVILGVTVTGLMWSLILNPQGGPIEAVFGLFGQYSDLLGSYNLAFPLVMGVQIWMTVGFSMVIFLAGLQAIPGELQEAAHVDGASRWQIFRTVTFPLLAPAVTVNVLLSIIGSLQNYQTVYVLTQGRNNTMVLGMQIFQQAFGAAQVGFGSMRQGYGSAISVIQFFLVLGIVIVFQLYLRRREVQL
ncbi:MAG TPA: sugar ABC transporter permease [Ktedonobacteraceae bacterium]|nr:sugar ABC transporter permease [Ktedonobacteraceae bacterium]